MEPNLDYALTLAERRWPGITFERKNGHEASGPCPFCHQATKDGFLCFEDGGFFCRKCGIRGWVDDDKPRKLTPEELTEIRLRRLERQQEEHEKRLSTLEKMHRCKDHLTYHQLMDDDDRAYWHGEGIYDSTIDRYLLGICYSCPTDSQHRASYTIPVVNGGKLVNIRHRLMDADNGDKYRPHMAGLGNTLFNADFVYKEDRDAIIIAEGEKKSIVLDQWGFKAVGLMGKAGMPDSWAVRFSDFGIVYVCLDPDAQDEARRVAGLFGSRGRVVRLPTKADDFFLLGGRPPDFNDALRAAWRVA